MPEPVDSERPRQYVPRNAASVHPAFPTAQPAAALDPSPALFGRLEPDTLFFVFYYQQGTYAQYLAARELKRHNWLFNKMFHTWFLRADDNRAVTADGEKGGFYYFEYEGSWTKLLKKDFLFEFVRGGRGGGAHAPEPDSTPDLTPAPPYTPSPRAAAPLGKELM